MKKGFKTLCLSIGTFSLLFGSTFNTVFNVANAEEKIDDLYLDTFVTSRVTGTDASGRATAEYTTAEGNIKMKIYQGYDTLAINVNNTALYVYKGNYLEFTALKGTKIQKISLTYNSTQKGDGIIFGTSVNSNTNKVIQDNDLMAVTLGTVSAGTHTFVSKSAAGLEHFYMQVTSNANANWLRFTLSNLKIFYSKQENSDDSEFAEEQELLFANQTKSQLAFSYSSTGGNREYSTSLIASNVLKDKEENNAKTFGLDPNEWVVEYIGAEDSVDATVAQNGSFLRFNEGQFLKFKSINKITSISYNSRTDYSGYYSLGSNCAYSLDGEMYNYFDGASGTIADVDTNEFTVFAFSTTWITGFTFECNSIVYSFKDVKLNFGGHVDREIIDSINSHEGYTISTLGIAVANTSKLGTASLIDAIKNNDQNVLMKETSYSSGSAEWKNDTLIFSATIPFPVEEDKTNETYLKTEFTAVAYIKVEDEILFLGDRTESVKSLAGKYLKAPDLEDQEYANNQEVLDALAYLSRI